MNDTLILNITDPVNLPRTRYRAFDRLLLKLINDPRDLPFLHFLIEATVVVVPIVLYLYLGSAPWFVAALYVPFNILVFMDRFILILHNTSHRPLFKKEYRLLNYYLVWVLGPLFGESPETYFAHHIGMHHIEENLEDDLSSTMPYQRDSFLGWLKYFLEFFFAVIVELVQYMTKKRRGRLRTRLLVGELSFYAFVAGLFLLNPIATLFVFIVPTIVCRATMMAGNWAQHAFIDTAHPEDPFKSSITIINCRYNRRCFNDGYHTGHHRMSKLHWTELPTEFQTNHDLYRANEAIIFSGIDYIMVWGLLMFKRYDTLASHFVDLQIQPRSKSEVIALLKSRVKVIPVTV